MNLLKIQQEILGALVREERIGWALAKNECFFITPDGKTGYCIPADQQHLKLPEKNYTPNLAALLDDNVITDTNELQPMDEYRREGKVRKYINSKTGATTFVAVKNLKNFGKLARLYQARPLGPILITERLPIEKDPSIVGLVMPMNINE